MNDYLKEIERQENERLNDFLESATISIKLSGGNAGRGLDKIEVGTYNGYGPALIIKYTHKTAYININCNSIEATARQLFNYVYTGKAQGFIAEEY
jgi:hypothetical protein